jgi:hypothetical protein
VVHCRIMTFSERRGPSKGESCRKMALPPDRPGDRSQAEQSPQRPPRKRRKDAGQPRWEDRDYYALQWIGQQGIIRFDQLRRLLGRESPDLDDWHAVLSESATRNAIDRWQAKHLVNSAYIVPKEQKYLWLSNAGLQFVELDLPYYSPKRQEVSFLFACNQVRLHLELLARTDKQEFGHYVECTWISMRKLALRDPEGKLHLPIAHFRTPSRGTLAIELVQAYTSDTEPVMRSYTKLNYSEIWYFAPSSVLPLLEETREKLKRSGASVGSIYTFNADAILSPPPRPSRRK